MVLKILLPALTIITAWLGGLSTFYTDWSWYESLNKATFNPQITYLALFGQSYIP